MQEDCNFTFHRVGRKWALLHYIVRLVFVLSPHPSEWSESLKDEVLNFFPGTFQLIGNLRLSPGSCLPGSFLLFLRGCVVTWYNGHFRFPYTTKLSFYVQRLKKIVGLSISSQIPWLANLTFLKILDLEFLKME